MKIWPFNRRPPDPDPLTIRHVITIEETAARCSCRQWNATFPVRGPLPMWARSHLMSAKGSHVDDDGVVPR